MRIAFSGSHRVGKSTLLEHVADALPRYATVEEPYYHLEEEGHEFPEDPSLEDFEAQLERSLALLEEGENDVLFDRCPADILAYLLVHEDGEAFEIDAWLDRIRDAMQTLDLVVFVPIEDRDRIDLPVHEDGAYRLAVHEKLEELLVDDVLGFEVDVLTVEGDVRSRVERITHRIDLGARGARRKSAKGKSKP